MSRQGVALVVLMAACGTARPPARPAESVSWKTIEGSKGAVDAIRVASEGAPGTPVLFIGATRCGSCKAYKASLTDPRMVEAHAPVHILEVDADRHKHVIADLGITIAGVPHWEMLDRTGKPAGKRIDGRAWVVDTAGNMAPVLGAFFRSEP